MDVEAVRRLGLVEGRKVRVAMKKAGLPAKPAKATTTGPPQKRLRITGKQHIPECEQHRGSSSDDPSVRILL
jgi:hypothetical protein